MKLYLKFLSYELTNIKRYPLKAFHIMPALIFLLISLLGTLFYVLTAKTHVFSVEDILPMILTSGSLVCIVWIISIHSLWKNAAIGFSQADANFLMPSPLTPFQNFVFIQLRAFLNVLSILWLIFFWVTKDYLFHLASPWASIGMLLSFMLALSLFEYVKYAIYSRITGYHVLRLGLTVGFVSYISLTIYLCLQNNSYLPIFYHPLLLYFPYFGWTIGLIMAWASLNWGNIIILTILLIVAFGIVYKLAKTKEYPYYEQELAHIQKTDKLVKEMKQPSQSKKIDASKTITQNGKYALVQRAFIQMGTWAIIQWSVIFKCLFLIGLPILLILANEQSAVSPMLVVCAILTYFRLGNKIHSHLFNDLYVWLAPIRAVEKIFYSLIIYVSRIVLYTISLTIGFSIGTYMTQQFNGVTAFMLFLIALCIQCSDLLYQTVIKESLHQYLFDLLLFIIDLLFLALSSLTLLPLIFIPAFGGLITISLLIGLLMGLLWLSVYCYHHIDRKKQMD